jgi:hypothetical protein
MYKPRLLSACLLIWVLTRAGPALCWGPEGHRIVGVRALSLLDASARSEVVNLLGGDSDELLSETCFWPDVIRNAPDWAWSSPQHYVNLPRHATAYDRQRDCPDGLCVTEAIRKYASELGRPELDAERRRQALAWLCHLVSDLHQPLHAAFRDDRGGNQVEIRFDGGSYNLHQFWDSALVRARLGTGPGRFRWPDAVSDGAAARWRPDDVDAWTYESHRIAREFAYPSGQATDPAFEARSWSIIQQQWLKAASRLALILNTVLGEDD